MKYYAPKGKKCYVVYILYVPRGGCLYEADPRLVLPEETDLAAVFDIDYVGFLGTERNADHFPPLTCVHEADTARKVFSGSVRKKSCPNNRAVVTRNYPPPPPVNCGGIDLALTLCCDLVCSEAGTCSGRGVRCLSPSRLLLAPATRGARQLLRNPEW